MSYDKFFFYRTYIKLDLHGFDEMTSKMMIQDFIKESLFLKREWIVIVHGKGQGVLLKATTEVLKKNPHVIEFQTAFDNSGCTIVHLQRN